MIVIVDYGMGNLGSIQNMFKHIGVETLVSSDPLIIDSAHKLILPGVGHFDHGMRNIRDRGLWDVLHQKALIDRVPVLGICLGMQLFMESSEEGQEKGLGWIKDTVVRFDAAKATGQIRIPHMGWNAVNLIQPSVLTKDLGEEPRFYFVHSFHAMGADPQTVLLTTHHGYDFVSAVQSENIYGVQFHPEKSHRFGSKLLQNFAEC